MRFTLIHGFNASPEGNFLPWLKEELEAKGHEVRVPELPLQRGEALEMQPLLELMEEKIGVLDQDDILLGHSLGGALAVRYLEYVELKSTPRALVLVAAPWKVNHPDLRSLFMTDLDYDVVPWKASEFVVVHSPDDSLVPFDHAQKWVDVLKARLVDADGNGHYMDAQYPALLETLHDLATRPVEYAPGASLPDELASVGGLKDREEEYEDI